MLLDGSASSITIPQWLRAIAGAFGPAVALSGKSNGPCQQVLFNGLPGLVAARARQLEAAGVRREQRVALMGESSPVWVVNLLALMELGALPLLLDCSASAWEAANILDHAKASAILSTRRFTAHSSRAAQMCSNPPAVLALEAGDTQSPGSPSPGDPAAPALVAYISGISHPARGVMLSHSNVMNSVMGAYRLIPFFPDDHLLSNLPLNHLLGLVPGVFGALSCGARVSFADSLMAHRLVAQIRAGGVTKMITVPALLRFLHDEWLDEGRPAAFFGERFRYVISGAAPLSRRLAESFMAAGCQILQGYGLTEASPVVTVNPATDNRPGTVGLPLPGTELRIAKDGEVLIRGPHVMLGYDGDMLETSRVLRGGWLHSGDVGFLDEHGYLVITGHKKAIVPLTSGKNLYTDELVRHFESSTLVRRCAVMVENSEHGYRILLRATPNPKELPSRADQESVLDELRRLNAHLAPWKRFHEVTFVNDNTSTKKP